MLVPTCDVTEFEKFGFKKCKRLPIVAHDRNYVNECYYLCVARGPAMIFVSPYVYTLNKWEPEDPKIHKNPNCRYRDRRDALDITCELIQAGMLRAEYY